MDRKWDLDRIRLELYALISKRIPALESMISGSLTASSVTVAPTVDLISTNVQAALEELQAEILAIDGSSFSIAGDVTGTLSATTVTKIQNLPISTSLPAINDVLTWNGIEWIPQVGSGGGGACYYAQVLGSTFTEVIPFATHSLANVNSTLILSPTGEQIKPAVSIVANTVTISSNINLLNHVVILGSTAGCTCCNYYTQTLSSGLTEIISPGTHGLSLIKSILVTDPSGNEISVQVSIVANTVTINSNINLLNHILTLS